jgi:hypothetical protein
VVGTFFIRNGEIRGGGCTTDKLLCFAFFRSRFNGQVSFSKDFCSTKRVPVGISSDSLCVLTLDSRILL